MTTTVTTTTTRRVPDSMPHSYPPLPGSPTLTNPDMILPDYDRTSSPDVDADRSQSPLILWKSASAANSSSELPHQLYTGHVSNLSFANGPITPTTPIIYGNGTMLSDIGEVTEAESTPGRPAASRRRDIPSRDGPFDSSGDRSRAGRVVGSGALQSSPTIGLEAIKRMARSSHERLRRLSLDSSTTITSQDQAALFADFDDDVSVGDSVFQGDDEESVADSSFDYDRPSYSPKSALRPADRARRDDNSGGVDPNSFVTSNGRGSAAALSQRAEQILANAKRRLTTMEGNLSRARSSLHASAPSVSSLGSDGPISSPHIPTQSAACTSDSPGHARMGSDNILRIGLPVKVYPQRSSSALGAAGGYRQPGEPQRTGELSSCRTDNNARAHHAASNPHDSPLEPLAGNENDDYRLGPAQHCEPKGGNAQLEAFLSPTFGPGYEDRTVTRSASTSQMRDLKDHMNDLKGKISTLREQARADSLRRRSFQSLRTPSPFTHAQVDQWYAEPDVPGQSAPNKSTEEQVWSHPQRSPWNGDVYSLEGEGNRIGYGPRAAADASSFPLTPAAALLTSTGGTASASQPEPSSGDDSPVIESPVGDAVLGRASENEGDHRSRNGGDTAGDDISDLVTEDGDFENEDENENETAGAAGYESDSGDSSYHDTLQHPISHEDREDAFDYEHFILHSALGTISQQRLTRGARPASFSSEDSVETTRGPAHGPGLRRRSSNASTSTAASAESFATAEEGRASLEAARRSPGSGDIVEEAEESWVYSSRHAASAGSAASASSHSSASFPAFAPISPFECEGVQDAVRSKGSDSSIYNRPSSGFVGAASEDSPPQALRSVPRRPASSAATMAHRPSVSSFESTGTIRSFPLVTSKKKASSLTSSVPMAGSLYRNDFTPTAGQGSSPNNQPVLRDSDGRFPSTTAATIYEHLGGTGPMRQLLPEDRFIVESLVAGIGRCVLGLSESPKSSAESSMYRRRIDAARRILEGVDDAAL